MSRPAIVQQGIQTRTDTTTGKQYIIYENDMLTINTKIQLRFGSLQQTTLFVEIIPIKGNVQFAIFYRNIGQKRLHFFMNSIRQKNPSRLQAYKCCIFKIQMILN